MNAETTYLLKGSNKAFHNGYFFEVEGNAIRKVNTKTKEGMAYRFDDNGIFYSCATGSGLNYGINEFLKSLRRSSKGGETDKKRILKLAFETTKIAVPKNHKYRALDNNVFEETIAGSTSRFRKLGDVEKKELIDSVYSVVKEAHDILDSKMDENARKFMTSVLQNNYDTLASHAEEFKRLYHIPILPPLDYSSLYIEATKGCPHNDCKFCDFYKDDKYRVKPMDEFEEHVNQVIEFHKPSMSRRHSVFLGAANALGMKTDDAIERLDYVNEEVYSPYILSNNLFPPGYYDVTTGILSFLDVKGALRKTSDDFREFYKRNLSRVYIGIESGSEETLKFINKPYRKKDDVLEAVRIINEGSPGIGIGLIFIAGFPGDHFEETADLMKKVQLGYNDTVFLSRLVPTRWMPDVDIKLVNDQVKGFYKVLKEKRENIANKHEYGFRVSEYNINDFFYY